MARLHYTTASGQVVRVLDTDALADRLGAPGAGEASFDLDREANAATLADAAANPSPYTVVGGVLRKDGSPVAVNPESPTTAQRRGTVAGAVRVQQDRSTTSGAFVDVPDLQFQLEP